MLLRPDVVLHAGAGSGPAFHGPLLEGPVSSILCWAVLLIGVMFGLLDQDVEKILVVGLEQHCLVALGLVLGNLLWALQRNFSGEPDVLLTVLVVYV